MKMLPIKVGLWKQQLKSTPVSFVTSGSPPRRNFNGTSWSTAGRSRTSASSASRASPSASTWTPTRSIRTPGRRAWRAAKERQIWTLRDRRRAPSQSQNTELHNPPNLYSRNWDLRLIIFWSCIVFAIGKPPMYSDLLISPLPCLTTDNQRSKTHSYILLFQVP